MSVEAPSQGRVAVISGGNRGLGFACGRELARRGYQVLLGARDSERGEKAVERLRDGVKARTFRVDVRDAHTIEALGAFIASDYGRLDVPVCAAGVFLEPYGNSASGTFTPDSTILDGDVSSSEKRLRRIFMGRCS